MFFDSSRFYGGNPDLTINESWTALGMTSCSLLASQCGS